MTSALIRKRLNQFKNCGLVGSSGKQLFCNYCNEEVTAEKKTTIENHLKSVKHQKKKESAALQPPIINAFRSQSNRKDNWITMASAFVTAGIPLHAFDNPKLRQWMSENLKEGSDLPTATTLRRYLKIDGDADLEETRNLCKNKDVLVMVDETQDYKTRKILNILMSPAVYGQRFRLVRTELLEKCNAEVVVQKIILALSDVGLSPDKMVCMISDNARYMLLAGNTLRLVNSRCMHSTCWAHIMHLVSDEIRASMKTTDKFISQVKASLIKSASRQQDLLNVLVKNGFERTLPPTPVLTRWTTWLKAGSYHFQHFSSLKEWIEQSDPNSVAIKNLKQLIQSDELYAQLEKIDSIYPPIASTIRTLEKHNLPACDVYVLLQTIRALFYECFQESSVKLDKYLEGSESHPSIKFWSDVQLCDPKKFYLNPAKEIPESLKRFNATPVSQEELVKYKILCSQIHANASIDAVKFWNMYKNELPELSTLCLAALSVPAASSEVERSFSFLKTILRPERNRFTEENLALHLRLKFNNRTVGEEKSLIEAEKIDSEDIEIEDNTEESD